MRQITLEEIIFKQKLIEFLENEITEEEDNKPTGWMHAVDAYNHVIEWVNKE